MALGIASCSANDGISPGTYPAEEPNLSRTEDICGRRILWGMWQFKGDMRSGTMDIIPQRFGMAHLNAMVFLEPPPPTLIKVIGPIQITGDVLDVDIGLTHPFLGQPTYTAFDVKGILITKANDARFPGPLPVLANKDVTHLMNPDGLTLWWGSYLFPPNDEWPNQGYIDGTMGTPDEVAEYGSNVNAYKYFCDDLGKDDDISMLNTENRGMFGVGKTNVRHYKIKVVGDEFIFNYAVDANWAWPTVKPPSNIPGDFPPHANQPEAYRVEVEQVKNTLYYDGYFGGGDLILDVTVYTWRDPSTTLCVFMESPEVFHYVFSETPVETGEGWAKYRLTATTCTCSQTGEIFILIGVQTSLATIKAQYPWGTISPITAYFPHSAMVGATPPTDGVPGTIRGLHRGEFNMIPTIPNQWDLDYYHIRSAIRGNHIATPMYITSLQDPLCGCYVAESFNGGETFSLVKYGGGGDNTKRLAIDSHDGTHLVYTNSNGYDNFSYIYKGFSFDPSEKLNPAGYDFDLLVESAAYPFLDNLDVLHIVYVSFYSKEQYQPYLAYEVTSSNFSDFSEPILCTSFPSGIDLSPQGCLSIDLAGDGEIFIAASWHPAFGSDDDIYFSHGYPGSMTNFTKVNQDASLFDRSPALALSETGCFIMWSNLFDGYHLQDCTIPSIMCAFIPSGSDSIELFYAAYGSCTYYRQFCPNSMNSPIASVIVNSGWPFPASGLKLSIPKIFIPSSFEPLQYNLIPYIYSDNNLRDPEIIISNDGVLCFRRHDEGPVLYYSYSPFDFY